MIKTMELDELKNTWNELSSQAKENQIFDSKVFDKMSKRKFDASLAKIILPELLGSIVCIGSAVFIGVNFHKFDKAYMQIAQSRGYKPALCRHAKTVCRSENKILQAAKNKHHVVPFAIGGCTAFS